MTDRVVSHQVLVVYLPPPLARGVGGFFWKAHMSEYLGNWQQFFDEEAERARTRFYWEEEVLGVRPTEQRPGSYQGRETWLKEQVGGGLVVIYGDNNEVCPMQTMAVVAEAAGFSNIGEYMLANLDSPSVADFLQTVEARVLLQAEFTFLTDSLRRLVADNDSVRNQLLTLFWRDEEQRVALLQATSLIQFLEDQVAIYRRAYEELAAEIDGEAPPEKLVGRVDRVGRDDAFGDWIYLNVLGRDDLIQ